MDKGGIAQALTEFILPMLHFVSVSRKLHVLYFSELDFILSEYFTSSHKLYQ
jgi:hypothetical protein